MLTLVIRICFVILSTTVALAYGRNYYLETDFPVWLAGVIGFAIAVTLIAMEQAFRRRFARAVVTVIVGLFVGLLLSKLILGVLDAAIQNPAIRDNIDIPIVLITTYLAIITILHHADRFRIIIPFVEFRSQAPEEGKVVCDLSALTDSRLAFLAQAGLFGHRLLVHERTIHACQQLSTSSNDTDQQRGQRALATLADLRGLGEPMLELESIDLPQADSDGAVALELARLEGARLCCSDRDILARAKAERIPVVDLSLLAEVLTAGVQPGDSLRVRIERAGEQQGQGVGFHRDGSMVVVSQAEEAIGEEVMLVVKRLHHTAQGRIIFGDRQETASFQRRRSTAE
ncbi:MAG: hypothetical protein EA401_04775 [Planctomycetota bacterium]|nr:MAG: hypothetical protein EA401_04775 [Planctomycetota bacterium]